MTVLEQLEEQLKHLPPEQQSEVLDFALFLRQRASRARTTQPRSLSDHPAFGSWRGRGIDALQYEQALRAEWDAQA